MGSTHPASKGDSGSTPPIWIGEIRKPCPSDLQEISVQVVAPGFELSEPSRTAYPDQAKNGELSIGTFRLKKVVPQLPKNPAQIAQPTEALIPKDQPTTARTAGAQ